MPLALLAPLTRSFAPSHSAPLESKATKDDVPVGIKMTSDGQVEVSLAILPNKPEIGTDDENMWSDACDYCGAKKDDIASLKRCATCGCNSYVSCALLLRGTARVPCFR